MSIYEKVNAIRVDALKLDWNPDKTFPKGGRMIPFVSGEKIKRQFAPLWAKHKVEFDIEVMDYQIHPELSAKQYTSTLSAKVKFILTDIEDGSKDESVLFGFAPADILQGPKTSISFAYNSYMTAKFHICDKLEDIMEDSDATVMEKLSQMSIPEVGNAPTTEKKSEKVSQPQPTVKTPKKDDSAKTVTSNLTVAENKAKENSMETVIKWLEDGKIIQSQYDEIKSFYDSIVDSSGVTALMRMVRTMKNDINSKNTEVGF